MATQQKIKSCTEQQFQNITPQNNELYIITDTEKIFYGNGGEKIILNPTPTKETVGLENLTNDKQIPLTYLDSNIMLGVSDEKISTQKAVKNYIDENFINKNDDLLLDGGTF